MKIPAKSQHLIDCLKNRILVLDGAMGTSLQDMNLTAADFGGESYLGCNEYLNVTNPGAIETVHKNFLSAGADIIETNTFGATPLVLAEYDISHLAYDINFKAVEIAKRAIQAFETPTRPKFIAGSIGPTTKSLSVTGGVTFDELATNFEQQAIPLIEAGADYLLLETAIDTLNLKAAYIGILEAFKRLNIQLPVAVSATIETMGTMLAGQGVEAMFTSVAHMRPLYVGLNCATGPEFMRDHIRTLSAISPFPVAVAPNAGIPDPNGRYPESPDSVAETLRDFIQNGWLNVIGGCCGTTSAHIKALAELNSLPPRVANPDGISRLSGLDPLTIEDDGRPYIVGERTNVIGSRAFKAMITEEKFEEAAEIARKQFKAGAHIIDVCLSNPDRNEVYDIASFMRYVSKLVKAPFMIDSQVPEVIEAAFKLTQGKCILNSVNLEDDGKFMKALMPVVQRYGAAVVVGCIDSEMAVTSVDKLRIAENAYQVLTETYGIAPEDIIFDPLVFPCGTGDVKYFGSGKETIEGIRLIKTRFPNCKTVLGISNVSFGLPTAGREVLNSVFLYHCTKAGLDLAIVNAEKLVRFAQISEEEKALCDDLIWYRTDNDNDPVAQFASHFRNKKAVAAVEVDRSTLSLDERIEINIVQGTKEYLIENLDLALAQMDPLGVINGPLMRAMDIVGKMFNNNELIVAEVLQSAEVMKTAVRHLEQFMSKADTNVRGTMLLATVKGDVHDIGKNLVQIILSNNGYNVVDLGIKCPPETLIQAYHDHSPNLIGLSGLLVKSAQQMVITATDLKAAGISIPILVGGAALTEAFTATKIAPEYGGPVVYCKDAMTGLSVANTLMDPNTTAEEVKKITDRQAQVRESGTTGERGSSKREFKEKLVISHDGIEITPPSLSPQIITADIQEVWKFLNLQMVFGNHLGYKGNVKNNLERGDKKLLKLVNRLDELKRRIVAEDLLTAKAVVQYFNAKRHGDSILIYDSNGTTVIETFTFPRQSDGLNLCLADFVADDRMDSIGMFVATCGDGVAEIAKELIDAGDYFDSHGLSAIALESAEAFAEYLHTQMRKQWGIPDPDNMTLEDIFKLKYTGVRVSFGYPACPRLEDQEKMFKLLNPERIGITLSEEYMMHPEASVSALVFHHPQARYFTISEPDLAAFESKLTAE